MRRFIRGMLTFFAVQGGLFLRAQAQEDIKVVWDASLDFFFDNREYGNCPVNWSQTLFGLRFAPEIGVRFEERHAIMAGINFLADFGAPKVLKADDYIAYYQYKGTQFSAYAGLIPRAKSIGSYSYAFFSDSIYYYAPNLSGLLLQYRNQRGYAEFGVDWNSKIAQTRREKFLLFLGLRINAGLFYAGFQANMYHHARSVLWSGVVDNMLIYPHVGIDLANVFHFELFDVQSGWFQAFQNDRSHVDKYVKPGGFQLRACLQKWHFGIDNTLYIGRNLMPYWVAPAPNLDYGPGLYWGEPFYRTDSGYDRLELYWQSQIGKRISLRFSSVHHFDGCQWGWQQKARLIVNLGQNKVIK